MIYSMFTQPHIPVTKAEIQNLMNQLSKPFILVGDMSARHKEWGENVDNTKGKIFEELLREEDISLHNSERPSS